MRSLFGKLYYELPRRLLGGFLPPCRNVTLEVTYKCNLRCEQCSLFIEEGRFGLKLHRREELSTEALLGVVRRLPPRSNLQLTGGEVFLIPEVERFLELAIRRHRVSIATNGLLIGEKLCEDLVRWGLGTLSFSVDGPEDLHDVIRRRRGGYRETFATAQKVARIRRELGRASPHLNFNCVILPRNFRRLDEVAESAAEAGADSLSFQVMDYSVSRSGIRLQEAIGKDGGLLADADRLPREELLESLGRAEARAAARGLEFRYAPPMTREEVVDYYQGVFHFERFTCGMPWSTLRVSPYGEVYPCLNYRVGNVGERSLFRLWNSRRFREFRRELARENLFASCVGCCKMVRKGDHADATTT